MLSKQLLEQREYFNNQSAQYKALLEETREQNRLLDKKTKSDAYHYQELKESMDNIDFLLTYDHDY